MTKLHDLTVCEQCEQCPFPSRVSCAGSRPGGGPESRVADPDSDPDSIRSVDPDPDLGGKK